MNHCRFDVYEIHEDRVIIRDIGPWDQHPTVTNDPQHAVDLLTRGCQGVQLQGRRLLYYDSDNNLDEIVIKEGRAVGFLPTLTKAKP